MRLVIPYKLSKEDGIELRYAIRSIYKHFAPLTGVLIIGDRPTWYAGDHIPLADLKGEKEKSMQLKVMQCTDEDFLYSNDDYYALQDFGLDLPNYYDYSCRTMAEQSPRDSYREMYNNCPPTWLNFDVHTPMIMGRARFRLTYGAMGDVQTPIKSTYANGLNNTYLCNPLSGTYLCDVKIRGPHEIDELVYKTEDRPFFSTHESAVDYNLIRFINNLYPDASPVEKPGPGSNPGF